MTYDPNEYDDKMSDWDFEAVYLEESEKAFCLEINGEEYWVPKSISRLNKHNPPFITVSVPEWWAKKAGLM